MFFELKIDLLDNFVVIPSLNGQLGQEKVIIKFSQDYLLLEDFDLPQQTSQISQLNFILLSSYNLFVLSDISEK